MDESESVQYMDDPGLEEEEEEMDGGWDEGGKEKTEEADEDLNVGGLSNRVWVVKLPRYVSEHWFAPRHGQDTPLGTLRVTSRRGEDGSVVPCGAVLSLEQAPPGRSSEYALSVTNETPDNTYVFATADEHTPHVLGPVSYEFAGTPRGDPSAYGKVLRQKLRDAAAPRQSVKIIGDADSGMRNRLMTGVHGISSSARFDRNFIRNAPNKNSPQPRAARIPKNELLDILFQRFDEREYWRLSDLRLSVNQPVDYLREVLQDIAVLIRGGDMNGMWKLNEQMAADRQQTHAGDDDDEEDMEEV